jgi:hypothetical protein
VTLAPGDRFITVQTGKGPIAFKCEPPAVGDRALFFPDGKGGFIAHKYAAPAVGDRFIVIPTRTGIPIAMSLAEGDWVSINTAYPYSGACARRPSDGKIFRCAGSPAYIWMSENEGVTWSSVNPAPIVGSQFVITQNGTFILLEGTFPRIHVSFDEGTSWTYHDFPNWYDWQSGQAIVIWGDNKITVFQGSMGRVYESSTYGATWTLKTSSAGWSNQYYLSAVVLDDDDNTIIVMEGNDSQNIWRSSNHGATWTLLSLPPWNNQYQPRMAVLSDGSIAFVGDSHDAWRSTDKGETWVQKFEALDNWPETSGYTILGISGGRLIRLGVTAVWRSRSLIS